MPQLNAIGIAVSDMAASIRFYRLLGLDVPETPDEGHVDAFLPNGVRVMLDCAGPAEVDEAYARVTEAGFHGEQEPWDAFWGQRYATLLDPDGVEVSLY